ncbi:MAG: hypothetical protein WCH62_01545 [Candidatus Omnitrophota bacterium]
MAWDSIGFWAGVMLHLWDIPLIVRVIRRKSAEDISLYWIWGLWLSSVLMSPSCFIIGNKIAMAFNIVNVTTLTVVLFVVIKYHKGKKV